MRHFPWARKTEPKQREIYARLRVARFDVVMLAGALVWCAPAAWCVASEQDSGSKATEYFGNGAEINVIVHDGIGNPISSTAMVRLYRDGTIPSGEGATSHGRVRFVVTSLGEFTVVVEPAGQPSLQKDVSVRATGQTQVDLFLRPNANNVIGSTGATLVGGSGTAAKLILAPKAQYFLTSSSPQDESVRLADKGLLDPPLNAIAAPRSLRDAGAGRSRMVS